MAPRNGRGNSPGGDAGGTLAAYVRFYENSYGPDYVGFVALLVGYILMVVAVDPFHRLFALNDLAIAFPHADVERVSVPMNFVYALYIPLAVLLTFNFFVSRANFHKHHSTILGLAIAVILTSFLTDLVKNTAGRPRPDLLSRCKPRPGTPRDRLVDISVCTETDPHTLQDGWRSFPSGHSSFSFAGLGYTAFFLAGQLHIFHSRRDMGRAMLCLAPLVGAAMIAMSRVQDYRHDVYDVCVGSALGLSIAFWSYRRYWPRLNERDSDVPHAAPSVDDSTERNGWTRVRDEEEAGAAASGRGGAYAMADL